MPARIIRPTSRGFLHLDSHPDGCARTVADLWSTVPPAPRQPGGGRRPVALVIGASAGYGLAAMIAGVARYGVDGVGVCFEKPPTPRRTATAGWYRVTATAKLAGEAGADVALVNADAFADATKAEVLDLIESRFGRLDHLIYSVAAPRRTDPDTGVMYTSVIKPIGAAHRTKTLVFDPDGRAGCDEVEIGAASGDDVAQTVQVMGGADWARWIDALAARDLLAPGFATVALSYIGSPLTAAIYRRGTIGAAKDHLEATARALDVRLRAVCGGRAATSVNGAAVTQSSTAIPGIALYIGLLRRVMGRGMKAPVDQLVELWDQLVGTSPLATDELGRIRLDTWELVPEVQAAIASRWLDADNGNIAYLADLDWFRDEVRRLYGFAVPGIDYEQPTEPDQAWPQARPGSGSGAARGSNSAGRIR
jgi:enoyl-[acyl-carrier protein] reductase/trans-2-enoyl-CoA reductase (NAD+)